MRKPVPVPAAPAWIDAEAAAEWRRSLEDLNARDRAEVNLSEFEVYCVAFSRWKEAERRILADGTEIQIRDDKGGIKDVRPSPQIGISQKAYEQMSKARNASGLQKARELSRAA